MNSQRLQRWIHIQHVLLILLLVWLIATSPWVHLYSQIPPNPTFWVWSHIILGTVALALTLSFSATCFAEGRLRHYFPWAFGRFRPLLSDLAGLLRLKIPTNEDGGLFSVIKGLLLLSLLAVAITGAMWLWTAGTREAVAWRVWHIETFKVLAVFLGLHVLATIAHLVQFIRQ